MRFSSHHRCLCLMLIFASFAAMSNGLLRAQQVFTWTTGGGNWTDSSKWATGGALPYPDAAGDHAVFTNSGNGTYDISLNQSAFTLGSITVNGTGSSIYRLGSTTNATLFGTLTLEQDLPGTPPVFDVTGSNRLAVFVELLGTTGFAKTGGGTLNFNGNTSNMTGLSGTVRIEQGTVWFNQAGNFGTGPIELGGNGTVFQLRGNFTTTFSANQAITIANGSNVEISNQANVSNASMVFEGPLRGGGNLEFESGTFTLNGANELTGNLTLTGTRLSLGVGSSLTSGNLVFGGTTASVLNLGGTSQTLQNLVTASPNSSANVTVSNGSLNIVGSSLSFGGMGNGAVLSFEGLQSLAAGSANGTLLLQPGSSTGTVENTIAFPTLGNTTLTGREIVIGNTESAGSGSGTSYGATVQLGATTEIRAHIFKVGSANATGALTFQTGLSSPTVRMRGTDGVSAMGDWVIGDTNTSGGTRSGQGIVNIANGTLDALVGNLTIGRNEDSTTASTSSLTISDGSLVADAIRLSDKSGSSTASLTAVLNQLGGSVAVTNLTLGSNVLGNSTLNATYNLSGGTLSASVIQAGSGNFASSSSRLLSISGNATLRNLSGSNLTLSGVDSSAGGLLKISTSGTASFEVDSGRSISLGAHSQLEGAANLAKRGGGTLSFAMGGSSFSGNLSLVDGLVVLQSGNFTARSLSVPLGSFDPGSSRGLRMEGATLRAATSGVNMTISGANASSEGRLSVEISGASIIHADTSRSVTIGSHTVISGSGDLTKTGTGLLTINSTLPSTYSGTLTLSAGRLDLLSNLPSAVALQSGTLSANASVGNVSVLGSATIEVASGRQFSLASSGVFSGTGNFTKTGAGTLRIESSAPQTYNGTMTLSSGTTFLSSNFPSTSTTRVTGGTLNASGTLGAVTLNTGASLLPGNGVGTLSAASLLWNGGTLSYQLGAGGNSDRIALSGAFTKGTGPTYLFDFNGGGTHGETHTLLTFASTNFGSGSFSAANLASDLNASFVIVGGTRLDLVIAPVPESEVSMLLLFSGIVFWLFRSRNGSRLGG